MTFEPVRESVARASRAILRRDGPTARAALVDALAALDAVEEAARRDLRARSVSAAQRNRSAAPPYPSHHPRSREM